jgi:hypothetical protein
MLLKTKSPVRQSIFQKHFNFYEILHRQNETVLFDRMEAVEKFIVSLLRHSKQINIKSSYQN